jgi:hypothetical protein
MVTNCRRKNISWRSWNWICTFWKGLRFQLIEGRAMAKWHQNLLKTWKRSLQKTSVTNGTIRTNKSYWRSSRNCSRVLSNQDEVKKLSDQVVAELLELFKENKSTTKESYLWRIYCFVLRINSKNWLYLSVKKFFFGALYFN